METKLSHEKELFGQPIGLFILFFTEMWERFSYYGMRAILTLYMISTATGKNPGLGWSNENALALYGWYTMLVYVMSIPGGILADKFIGQKKAVMIGGLTLVLGHGVLAIPTQWAFFLGLSLIVLGVGCLKPNISTMVGGLYPQGDERRDGGFTIFYIGINIGAFLAAIIVGTVGETIGWHYGFGLAGIGMLLGQLVYMSGQKYLVHVGNSPEESRQGADETSFGQLFRNLLNSPKQLTFVCVMILVLVIFSFYQFTGIERLLYSSLFSFLAVVAGLLMMIYKDIDSIEKDRFIVLLISFLIIIVFWGAFEQAGGLLNIYTEAKIDRVVPLNVIDILFYGGGLALLIIAAIKFYNKKDSRFIFLITGILIPLLYGIFRYKFTDPYEIPTSVFQSVNALFIIIFGTLVSGFWYWMRNTGKENSSLFKMAIGTIIMGIGFLFMAKASNDILEYGDKAALILLILAYLFHTLGELCSSPVALSFITKVAPLKYVSIMMGVYFAATGLGNKVAGSIGEASQAKPAEVQLVADPVPAGLVEDSIFAQAKDFQIVSKAYVNNGKVAFDESSKLKSYFKIDTENIELLKGYLEAENATQSEPQTVIARFSYDPDKQKLIEEGSEKTDISFYEGKMEVFDFQNHLEYKTFIAIFIMTLVFGILVLLFLKKLKKLTHGAEDAEPEVSNAESIDLNE